MEKWEQIAKEFFPNEFESFKRSLSGGRRPDAVEFTDIKSDVKRRDLTINALFYDLDTHEIVDLVGGVNDLKKGLVKTVGDPAERFGEDRLRILRAIRFAGRFGSELDPKIDAALKKDSRLGGFPVIHHSYTTSSTNNVSSARIRDEFLKGIKSAKSVVHFLSLIDKYDLFKWVFPELKINKDFIEDKDPILVISVLLKSNDTTILSKQLNKITYTIDEIKGITFLINLLKLSLDTAIPLKKLQKNAGVSEEQMKNFGKREGIDNKLLDTFIRFRLTVSGEDLMQKLNLKPGKQLGDAIYKAEFDNFKKML